MGLDEDDDDWYKFDDDKVSLFPGEKLATLGGGGMFFLSFCNLFKRLDIYDRGGFVRVCAFVQKQACSVESGIKGKRFGWWRGYVL